MARVLYNQWEFTRPVELPWHMIRVTSRVLINQLRRDNPDITKRGGHAPINLEQWQTKEVMGN